VDKGEQHAREGETVGDGGTNRWTWSGNNGRDGGLLRTTGTATGAHAWRKDLAGGPGGLVAAWASGQTKINLINFPILSKHSNLQIVKWAFPRLKNFPNLTS
jgi:hypothetical protein